MGLITGNGTDHRYQQCDDEYCERFPCRVYKEGYREGYADGHGAGYSSGFAEATRRGTPTGQRTPGSDRP